MDNGGLDLLLMSGRISTEQERRTSVDDRLERGNSMASSFGGWATSPKASSFGLARLSFNPSSFRRSEDSALPFSKSLPFGRTFSLERTSSSTVAGDMHVNSEDMEAMVSGYALQSAQSTPPMPVPKVNKGHAKGKFMLQHMPTSPVVGRAEAASMGDIDAYWKSMYLE